MTNTAVDTSRLFSSVKEAVVIFGDSIPFKEVRNSPTQDHGPPIFGTLSPWKSPREVEEQVGIEHVPKKLEEELSKAKEELKLLKKEMETEVTVAALNDELHRSMSRLAKAEADAASRRWTGLENGKEQHAVNKGKMEIMSYSLSLAQIPSVGDNKQEGEARDRDAARKRMKTTVTIKKQQKQKPIVPLVWELFSRRKTSADDPHK